MKALSGLRIETMGGRVPKTGRLYLIYTRKLSTQELFAAH